MLTRCLSTTNIDIGFENKQHLILALGKTKNAVSGLEKVTNLQSSIVFIEQVNLFINNLTQNE